MSVKKGHRSTEIWAIFIDGEKEYQGGFDELVLGMYYIAGSPQLECFSSGIIKEVKKHFKKKKYNNISFTLIEKSIQT